MLFQLNPSSSMIINRARLTSAASETRDRVNDTNARRSSLVRLKTDCMLHIVLLKSMLHNTSMATYLGRSGQKEGPVMQKTILLLISLWLSTEVQAQTPFYQGKTITLIVGSGAGTAYDIYARLLGSYVGKYLPGNPTVVVQNMPAAGGMVAANF